MTDGRPTDISSDDDSSDNDDSSFMDILSPNQMLQKSITYYPEVPCTPLGPQTRQRTKVQSLAPKFLNNSSRFWKENTELRRKLIMKDNELKITKAGLNAAEAHCTLGLLENQALRMELDRLRGKRKTKRVVNTEGRVLTAPELHQEWEEKTAEKRAKEQAEMEKQKAKEDAQAAREIERAQMITSRVFTVPLSRFSRKEDLKDIAACFGLLQNGRNLELTARIKAHMQATPSLRENPRFKALFGKQKGPNVAENIPSPFHHFRNGEGSGSEGRSMKMEQMQEQMQELESEGEDSVNFDLENIDPSLRYM
ncbi:hypothetical protein M422DRAFT_53245 [Sphaerobolus stellatus SS14]|uniref:Uncharacterized protein n=1 Tax=Sphaerobolus stellatus (strain SS14) TaxID=990650 RepID=A0A0C9URE9_SPHS4|nr:hypothetical protein M422DRAFT_53245 [Sphaerobolus stellatus SS14]